MFREILNSEKKHPLVKAAHDMVREHERNDMMLAAVEAVKSDYQELSEDLIIALWIGINAKDIDG